MSILDRHIENHKVKAVPGSMMVTNLYTAGVAGEAFLRSLKDREEILGSYCATCKKAFLPAKLFCERCLSRLSEAEAETMKRVAPSEGQLQTFTKVYVDLDNRPLESPQVIGFVTFKGFEGGLIHRIFASNEKKLKAGAKVKVVFEPSHQRKGSILDIAHFEVL